jgi:hypothetical protein
MSCYFSGAVVVLHELLHIDYCYAGMDGVMMTLVASVVVEAQDRCGRGWPGGNLVFGGAGPRDGLKWSIVQGSGQGRG